MKFLLTAFEPFGGNTKNASMEAVNAVCESAASTNAEITVRILPVVHKEACLLLDEYLDECQPDVVLCFGEAGGRAKISLEKIAINYCNFRIADNAGETIQDAPINPDGPVAYFSTLPLRQIETEVMESGIPVEISLTAGSYLCNEVFYHMMNRLSQREQSGIGGFIHLPLLPEVAASGSGSLPSMSVQNMKSAILKMVEICSTYQSGRGGL